MKNEQSLMQFPCDFQIKIIGNNHETFEVDIVCIARKHFPDLREGAVRSQVSQQGNFLSITLTVYAQDQDTLDALYRELTQHPDIKMVL